MTHSHSRSFEAVPKDSARVPGLPQGEVGNWLLRVMDPADYDLLRPLLRRVAVSNGDLLAEAGAPIENACFLEGGIAGFLDVLDDGRRLAIGLLGREGFVGWPLLMGNDRWPHEVMARGRDTTALRIETAHLSQALLESGRLRDLLLRYASTFFTQMARTIVSNLIHPVEKRTARWLLLYHDRIDGDELEITHDELGAMLGVRRASVTDALHDLEGRGAIRLARGRLLIRDRLILEGVSGDTYGRAEAEYERLIGGSRIGSVGRPT